MLLEINNLHVTVDNKPILKGVDLIIQPGEVHAIMGPNGSGKSTLAYVLAGRQGYEVTQGTIHYNGQDLLKLSIEERAHQGVFLAMQYPVEIPGVTNIYLLKAALNSLRQAKGEIALDAFDFTQCVKEKIKQLQMDESLLYRPVNEGFSGGEKKRNEMLQLALLEPQLAILDETDSGLDIDALKIVAEGVNQLRDPKRGFLLITHYQRLLDYIVPDKVHVLAHGKIIKTGDKTLATELEKTGYADINNMAGEKIDESSS